MSTPTVKQTLLLAADHIEKVGHHKGNFFDYFKYAAEPDKDQSELPCCALGAVRIVSGYQSALRDKDYMSSVYDLFAEADEALRLHLGVDGVPAWNDAPERTQAEVVTALREAAEKADS